MLYVIIISFGNSKGSDYNDNNKKNVPLCFQWTKSSTLTSSHLSTAATYTVTTCILTVVTCFPFDFSYRLFTLHRDHYPVVSILMSSLAFVPNYCKFIRSCWVNFKAFFCISVVSWTAIYCVEVFFSLWTKLFSVKLKPKGVLFYFIVIFFLTIFFSLLFYTDWKYLLYVAFNSNLIAGILIYCFGVTLGRVRP